MKSVILSILAIGILFVAGLYAAPHFLKNNFSNPDESINQPYTATSVDEINTPKNMQNNDTNLKIDILKQGSGPEAKAGDKVTVDYVGTLLNGEKFDSSIDRKQSFSFILGSGQVIQGWEKGILGMKVGEKRKLTIPPELGYGAAGTPGGPIPPNATLIFEVDLLKIN